MTKEILQVRLEELGKQKVQGEQLMENLKQQILVITGRMHETNDVLNKLILEDAANTPVPVAETLEESISH